MTHPVDINRERLSLTAWSPAANRTHVLATYQLSDAGRHIEIQPSGPWKGYFQSLGLPERNGGFELDIEYAPVGSIAKAFGFNYDDPAIRQMLNALTDGALNSANLGQLAAQGYAQVGKLHSQSIDLTKTLVIERSSLVDPSALKIPAKLHYTEARESRGMKTQGVLVRASASQINHGYLISCSGDDFVSDRLAIHAATNRSLARLKGLTVDEFSGFKVDADGKRCALYLDNSKPSFKSARNTLGSYHLDQEFIQAQASHLPMGSFLRSGSTDQVITYLLVRLMKDLAQDVPLNLTGTQFNAPMMRDGSLVVGPISVNESTDLPVYKERAKEIIATVPKRFEAQAKMFSHTLTGDDLERAVGLATALVLDTFGDAIKLHNQLEKLSIESKKTPDQKGRRIEDDGLGI